MTELDGHHPALSRRGPRTLPDTSTLASVAAATTNERPDDPTPSFHGAALDIAGKGLADAGSMKEATLLAIHLAERMRGHGGAR
ncbi:MAG TPA: hypothetical protein VFJ82_05555 [Longimicrobium sp.]|nr:hypothetical protein [Longimicrobium sp.]